MTHKIGVFAINWVDYLFLAILVFSCLRGWASGILGGIVRIVSLLGGFWIATTYHTKLAAWLSSEWGWADSLSQILKPLVKLPGPLSNTEILSLPVGMLQKISASIPLPSPWPEIIGHLSEIGPKQTVGQAINLLLAQGIIEILSFIALFILAKGIISFIGAPIVAVVRFSPLRPFDKTGGLALGFITGCVIIVIIITVLAPLQVPLALIGAQGMLETLERGLSGSYIMSNFGPMVQRADLFPSLIPDFDKEFLFKQLTNPEGKQI